jgi:alanyl-tRNA synthetase
VGLIKIIGTEKIRGRVLVRFLAGELAINDYSSRFSVTDRLSRSLTCHPVDLPAKVDKLTEENKRLRKELAQAHRDLLPARAQSLAASGRATGQIQWVACEMPNMEPSLVGQLAGQVADLIGGLAVLLADNRLVIAVGKETGWHAGDLARRLAAQASLKGGGSKTVAQLGGAEPGRLEAYMEQLLARIADD